MPSNGKQNGAHAPADTDWDDPTDDVQDFWAGCKLTTILTDPPQHELRLPSGQTLRLRTSHFFDVERFTVAFVDATGSFPPMPKKKQAAFLRDLFRSCLSARDVVDASEEAGDRGTLLGDIRLAIAACPDTEDPRDLERGAAFSREDGSVWVNARSLMERVRRVCPVKLTPADFYAAMTALGCRSLGNVRAMGWQGKAWSVPPVVRGERVSAAIAETVEVAASVQEELLLPAPPDGFFDDP